MNVRMAAPNRYVLDFRDHRGDRHRITAYKSESASWVLARLVEEIVAVREYGDVLPSELTERVGRLPEKVQRRLARTGLVPTLLIARPLSDLLDEWQGSILARGRTAKHARSSRSRAGEVFKACGFRRWPDIDAGRVERYLANEREGGLSVSSSNHKLAACQAFCAWALEDHPQSGNPLRRLRKLNPDTDPRLVRRALTTEEVDRFFAAAHAGPTIGGLSGPERVLVYWLAITSGLRRAEIMALEVASFDLDAEYVVLPARASKHRKTDRVGLPSELCEALSRHFEGRDRHGPAFSMHRSWRAGWSVKQDCEAAEIPVERLVGRMKADAIDFHALRTTCATWAAEGGAVPAVLQEHTRHSSPDLVMKVYARIGQTAARRALAALPVLEMTPAGGVQIRAIADDDRAGQDRSPTNGEVEGGGLPDDRNPEARQGLDDPCPALAVGEGGSGGGTRTPDTRIMIDPTGAPLGAAAGLFASITGPGSARIPAALERRAGEALGLAGLLPVSHEELVEIIEHREGA